MSRLEPEILSGDENDGVITVFGSEAILRLRYEGLVLRFDLGRQLSLDDLDAAAVAYWDEFAARAPRT